MGFPRRKRKESLSELQGVPEGTFRCDVCKFIQPSICICGTVIDAENDLPPKTYILCSVCALWLGSREPRFPQGLCFNFSDEQREKIRVLCKELDISNKDLEKTISIVLASSDSEEGRDSVRRYLERVPNSRELNNLRFSLLPQSIIDLSSRLTRGETVDPYEIMRANEG